VLVSKLTGAVDPAKILEFAPGELKNLTNWQADGDDVTSTLGDYQAVELGGSYTKDGAKRVIVQKTVVIPIPDGVYAMQLNGDAVADQKQALMDAKDAMFTQTTFTP
jgi:hypothetical protein